jgi:hypothetical protein
MIRNAERLAPVDGRLWREYRRRVIDNPGRDEALGTLDAGDAKGLSKNLKLEGPTHADCLIECERAFVWIEGKRNDWLSPSIKWDVNATNSREISAGHARSRFKSLRALSRTCLPPYHSVGAIRDRCLWDEYISRKFEPSTQFPHLF